MVTVKQLKAVDPVVADRLSEAWKDELLSRSFISGLEIMQMPQERREWVYKYPEVFKADLDKDGYTNELCKRLDTRR